MAVASLVLGILSWTCLAGPFTGIPAIILGHIAYKRSRKDAENYSGGGMAVAGCVLGYAITVLSAGMILPSMAKAQSKRNSIMCVHNLQQIGLAFRIYAKDNGDLFPFQVATNARALKNLPSGLAVLDHDLSRVLGRLARELDSVRVLICPADQEKRPAADAGHLTGDNISYEIEIKPEVTVRNPMEVLARCPIHGHRLHCDGSVSHEKPFN